MTTDPRPATTADLPAIREVMDFAERRAILHGLTRLSLYTNEVMTENQAIYTHLGYREVSRHAEDGYRRVYMEKLLGARA